MAELFIPIGINRGTYRTLTPEAQNKLLEIIDYTFDHQTNPNCTKDQFREGMIELLDSGEAYIDIVPGGYALKLVPEQ